MKSSAHLKLTSWGELLICWPVAWKKTTFVHKNLKCLTVTTSSSVHAPQAPGSISIIKCWVVSNVYFGAFGLSMFAKQVHHTRVFVHWVLKRLTCCDMAGVGQGPSGSKGLYTQGAWQVNHTKMQIVLMWIFLIKTKQTNKKKPCLTH